MRIAEPFRLPGGEAGVDLWPAFNSLRKIPAALIRGARSDILSPDVASEMVSRHPALDYMVVSNVGHAPTLSEPECVAAIDRLLAKVSS
jgi:pimeloyl-ACP methyl ester carboxylesterase